MAPSTLSGAFMQNHTISYRATCSSTAPISRRLTMTLVVLDFPPTSVALVDVQEHEAAGSFNTKSRAEHRHARVASMIERHYLVILWSWLQISAHKSSCNDMLTLFE